MPLQPPQCRSSNEFPQTQVRTLPRKDEIQAEQVTSMYTPVSLRVVSLAWLLGILHERPVPQKASSNLSRLGVCRRTGRTCLTAGQSSSGPILAKFQGAKLTHAC